MTSKIVEFNKNQTTLEDISWLDPNPRSMMLFKSIIKLLPKKILQFNRSDCDNLVVAFSGGTDSTLLLLICKEYNIELNHIVLNNTRLMAPETNKYVRRVIKQLGYEDIFDVTLPEMKRSELIELILEDHKRITKCGGYSKSWYRCCKEAKEKPMKEWLKKNDLKNDQTIICRGVRGTESTQRFQGTFGILERNHLYNRTWAMAPPTRVSDPLLLMPDDIKRELLLFYASKYRIDLPRPSGCIYCPIYYKFLDKKGGDNGGHLQELLDLFQSSENQTQILKFIENEEMHIV